eukprot:6714481-Lingulodinium_polyedra.AAC.1
MMLVLHSCSMMLVLHNCLLEGQGHSLQVLCNCQEQVKPPWPQSHGPECCLHQVQQMAGGWEVIQSLRCSLPPLLWPGSSPQESHIQGAIL